MEIYINGQAGIAAVEEDALNLSLGHLYAHLREELTKQCQVIRSVHADGTECFPDEVQADADRPLSSITKLDLEVASFGLVSFEVVQELADKAPSLKEEAVRITEVLQTGNLQDAREKLKIFADTVGYIVQTIGTVAGLVNVKLADVCDDESTEKGLLKLGEFLKEIDTAINEQDYATVGDILEFDVAPSLDVLLTLLDRLKTYIFERLDGDVANEG